ncbi:MAG: primosomal protein N' [Alphaproteobacteria bacterium]|nr:primosomal protein N' [Alphaproteobacteria bacterium]
MNAPALKPPSLGHPHRAGVLLPLPLGSAYDYSVEMELPRGTLVEAPLGPRRCIGVVWQAPDGSVDPSKLKTAVPLAGKPRLPESLCTFIDWVARYTLTSPGLVLALALRTPQAFAPEGSRRGYIRGGTIPARMTPERERVLQVTSDGLARSASALAEEANVSPAVVRGLIGCGALSEQSLPEFDRLACPDPAFTTVALNFEQEAAARTLRGAVASGQFSAALLDGVTGSGKTEVYFEAVAEALRREKQILILLPEIALTVQFLDRFAERFGCRPAEWHSDLSQKERRRTYRAVMRGEARVVVGARSALFLPFPQLGLLIVDEEHEQAYKQEEGAIYHARDMAVVRARIENCPVVLASATPSLETYVNASTGRYKWLKLPRRHGAAVLPEIRLIDLRHERTEAGTWLSQPLRNAITAALGCGEQALLFLNRRGYAALTLCECCGHKMTCSHCSAWLVEHRYHRKLVCHHCGYQTALPHTCPQCQTPASFMACGPGVERVAEEFATMFPQARMAIASSDILHGPAETQAAIRAMEKHEIDVVIGTQIVAKGHHFPQLTLVGIVDADLGGFDGDLRARERTFQLLHQVSGRAGRAEKPGQVLIQTRNPDDMVMQALASGERNAFYDQERLYRQRAGAPPFGHLAAIILSGADGGLVRQAGRMLAKAAPSGRGVKLWGPAPAFYQMLRGRTRERLLVQTERHVEIQAYLRAWLAAIKLPNAVRLTVDVDPVSFF